MSRNPDELDDHNMEFAAFKLWGRCYFEHVLESDERLQLFLDEQLSGFNFGGDELNACN